ncbi:(2Fe-2S)-binding protein [Hyphomicrobiales bacterium]|jgi:carbon-monoxide dehydrogenase small subunit|nr:(2Fe-2S)-binding protein [Hyphomicrobiales bacterium]MDG1524435.1 (2Fe-2S)-binding protein [Hyphomicrobiales bacterium]MDG2413429.1 (2Fe-2S)-binding protein [Hyphomicrobiales bacterium]|tara:strand:- start:544 stop:1011 length:468 start_codon:yes stop_codon:yes gene_type:complete
MPLVEIEVNGKKMSSEVEERQLLVHFLRDDLNLTGTHVGCDTSQCGACVIHLNGIAVKSCSMLAVQANKSSITTIEGLAEDNKLHPVQEAFKENHGLQCGFCTPGMIMAAVDLINRKPVLNEKIVREELEGNLCRCTGYQNIVKSILAAAEKVQA